MAAIRFGSMTSQLEPEHLVGRKPACALYLDMKYVSGQHAIFRYLREHWELRDLGSRNGTWLDGVLLKPGEWSAIRLGAKICFGKQEQEWEVINDAPPQVMAVPLASGNPIMIEGELLTLPTSESPRATIYRGSDGVWILEQPDSIAPIKNLQVFEFEGQLYRFSCPELSYETSLADSLPPVMSSIELRFFVSRDEEHVQLRASWGVGVQDLGDRSHNYLLLTLARRRVADLAEGLPESSCGWLDPEDFAHDPSMAPSQLNVDVFRVRKHFAACGVPDAANVVERRARAKQLRLGTGLISIVTV